tara:strand:+ start:205 stop:948 length:744 start_codon:yes stop_codon:yes gene_type:complete
MTDENYSRMPDVLSNEKEEEIKEEMIFKEPDKIIRNPTPKTSENPDEKKQRLKEHLARCREKSAIVRKQKKEEKLKNKKPRGRPKKKVVEEVIDNGDNDNIDDNIETKESVLMKIEEKTVENIEKEVGVGVAVKDEPINKNFNMIDYEKLTNMIYEKMTPKTNTPKPVPVQTPPKIVNNQNQLNDFLKNYSSAIRIQEQNKYKQEQEQKQKEELHKRTKKYYGKLPPTNYFQPENDWDNIFNPRNKR